TCALVVISRPLLMYVGRSRKDEAALTEEIRRLAIRNAEWIREVGYILSLTAGPFFPLSWLRRWGRREH
ncbi:hypothetical protein ACFLXE_02125, partial [Chloroflexota bacterium]